MTTHQQLKPADQLAKQNGVRFPNESSEYRRARDALLTEEIELRRHIERVAEQRRALPAGGKVPKNYAFVGDRDPADFSFGRPNEDESIVRNFNARTGGLK